MNRIIREKDKEAVSPVSERLSSMLNPDQTCSDLILREESPLQNQDAEEAEAGIVIPTELPSTSGIEQAERDRFTETRSKFLLTLQASSRFLQAVKTLNPEVLYRVAVPEGTILPVNASTGLSSGVLREGGAIKKHVKFETATQAGLEVAKALGIQCILMQISAQLGEIEEKLNQVIQGQRDDRIAEIEAGLNLYQQALACSPASRDGCLQSAIQGLQTGVKQCLKDLHRQVEQIKPQTNNPALHFLEKTWIQAKSLEGVSNKEGKLLTEITQLFRAISRGGNCLIQCWIQRGETEAAATALYQMFEDLQECGLDKVIPLARSVDIKKYGIHSTDGLLLLAPEDPFIRFCEKQDALTDLASQNETSVFLEFRPNEFYENEEM
jgi:hypothetical protein